MASNPESSRKKEIRKEIRKSSRQEFILNEMKRLGFWPNDEDRPSLAEEHLQKQIKLSNEIRELSRKDKAFQNKDAVLKRFKKERLRKSREKQKENKEKREEERLERKAAWAKQQTKDIIYLGEKYSASLQNKTNDLETLQKNNLPKIQNVLELAKVLKTSINELRFLSYHRFVSKSSHYIRYAIPKKSGGVRKISAPQPRLKTVQRSILDELFSKLSVSEYAHGFLNQKSILTNATPHIKADLVVNMDLKDFFPTLDYKRINGLIRKLGFSDQIATVLSLICTEPVEEKVKIDGEIFYVNQGERVLPQGAPTSPMLTNVICFRLDQRMAGIARKLGFTYTRYADDMTFSGDEASRQNIKKLMWQTKAVIKDEGFNIHPKKTKIMSTGNRKEVTGIVVNEKTSIEKSKLKSFRALLYQIEKDGPVGKKWGTSSDLMGSILGFARYIYMVDPVKGKKYLAQVEAIRKKHAPKKVKPSGIKKPEGGKPWWKFW